MKTLTKGEQFIYDWQYKRLGATSFKGYLSKALAVADNQNWAKLFKAFPDEAMAMNNFHTTEGWWARVQDKYEANQLLIMGNHSPQTRVATTKEEV